MYYQIGEKRGLLCNISMTIKESGIYAPSVSYQPLTGRAKGVRVILTTKFVRIQKSNLDSDACYAVSE